MEAVKKSHYVLISQSLEMLFSILHFLFLAKILGPSLYMLYISVVSLARIFGPINVYGRYSLLLRSSNDSNKTASSANEVIIAVLLSSFVATFLLWPVGSYTNSSVALFLIPTIMFSEVFIFQIFNGFIVKYYALDKYTKGMNLGLLLAFLKFAIVLYLYTHDFTKLSTVVFTKFLIFSCLLLTLIVNQRLFKDLRNFSLSKHFKAEGFRFSMLYSANEIYINILILSLNFVESSAEAGKLLTCFQIIFYTCVLFNKILTVYEKNLFEVCSRGALALFKDKKIFFVKYISMSVAVGALFYLLSPILPKLLGAKYAGVEKYYFQVAIFIPIATLAVLGRKLLHCSSRPLSAIAALFLSLVVYLSLALMFGNKNSVLLLFCVSLVFQLALQIYSLNKVKAKNSFSKTI